MSLEAMCSVCADVLLNEGEVVATSCHHVFHALCLNQWILRSKTCPECREAMNKPAERLFFRSEARETFQRQREELYHTQIITLRNDKEELRKQYEEQLQAETQIREGMHNKIKHYEAVIQQYENAKANVAVPPAEPAQRPLTIKADPDARPNFGFAATSGACSSSTFPNDPSRIQEN